MEKLTMGRKLANVVGQVAFLWTILLSFGLLLEGQRTIRLNTIGQGELQAGMVAHSVASQMDGDRYMELVMLESDHPDVLRQNNRLRRAAAPTGTSSGRVNRLFTVTADQEPGVWRYGFGFTSPERNLPFNERYPEKAPSAFQSALSARSLITEAPVSAAEFVETAATAPVFDSSGNVVALVSVTIRTLWPPLVSRRLSMTVLIVIIGSTLFGMVATWLFSPALTKPVRKLSEAAAGISEGNLNLQIGDVSAHDEFIHLANGFSKMVQDLRGLVGQIRISADSLREWGGHLRQTATHAGRGAGEIARMINEVAVGSDIIASKTTTIASEFSHIDRLTGSVSQRAALASHVLGRSSDRVEKGVQVLGEAVQRAGEAAQTLNISVERFGAVRQWSGDIAETTRFIVDLSEQVNMLAMNAQIEAARAGEYGRGFTVVAQKVSGMAEETLRFADKIAKVNKAMLSQIEQVGTAMETANAGMADSVGSLDDVRATFDELSSAVREIAEFLEAIAESTVELKSRTALGRQDSDAIADVTQVSAASIEEVNAGSQELAAISEQVEAAVNRLNELAGRLSEGVARFKL